MEMSREKDITFCRVCHGESEPGRELYFPCKCDGSIKYIHQDCLLEWIRHSGQGSRPRCELCGEEFRFQHVYRDGAPLTLTILDLIWELIPRLVDFARAACLVLFSLVSWGIFLPLFANWWTKICWCLTVSPNIHACTNRYSINLFTWDHILYSWYDGIIDICVIVTVSFFLFELGRMVCLEVIAIERSHAMRMLQRCLDLNLRTIMKLEEENQALLDDIFLLVHQCIRLEVNLVPIHEKDREAKELKERWQMSLEDVALSWSLWKEERRHQASGSQSNFAYYQNNWRVDRSTGGIVGQGKLFCYLSVDQRFIARLEELLLELQLHTTSQMFPSLRQYISCSREVFNFQHRCFSTRDFIASNSQGSWASVLHEYANQRNNFRDITLSYLEACRQNLEMYHMYRDRHEGFFEALAEHVQEEQREAGGDRRKVDQEAWSLEAKARILMCRLQQEERVNKARTEVEPETAGERLHCGGHAAEEEEEMSEVLSLMGDETVEDYLSRKIMVGAMLEQMVDVIAKQLEYEEETVVLERKVLHSSEVDGHNRSSIDSSVPVIRSDEMTSEEIVDREQPMDGTLDEQPLSERANQHNEKVHGEEEARPTNNPQTLPEVFQQNATIMVANNLVPAPVADPQEVPVQPVNRIAAPVVPVAVMPLAGDGGLAILAPRQEALLQRGIPYIALCIVYIMLFIILAIILPSFFGKLLFQHSTMSKMWNDLVIKQGFQDFLERDGNIALLSKIFDYGANDPMAFASTSSSSVPLFHDPATIHHADPKQLSEIYLKEIRATIEIFTGYFAIIGAMICFYLVYCLKYFLVMPYDYYVSFTEVARSNVLALGEMMDLSFKTVLVSLWYVAVLPGLTTVLLMISLRHHLPRSLQSAIDWKTFLLNYRSHVELPEETWMEVEWTGMQFIIYALFNFLLSFGVMAHLFYLYSEVKTFLNPDIFWVRLLPDGLTLAGANAAEENHPMQPNHLLAAAPGDIGRAFSLSQQLYQRFLHFSYFSLLKTCLIHLCLLIPGVIFTVILPLRVGHKLVLPLFIMNQQPLEFRLNNMLKASIPLEMILSHVLIPILIDRIHYVQWISKLMEWVVVETCHFFSLSHLLHQRYRGGQSIFASRAAEHQEAHESWMQQVIRAVRQQVVGLQIHPQQHSSDVRLALGLVLLMAATVFVAASILHYPLQLGRLTSTLLFLPANNDMFNYPIGVLVGWGLHDVLKLMVRDVLTVSNLDHVLRFIWKWMMKTFTVLAALLLWIVLPPLLVGYLMEALLWIPARTSWTETAEFNFLQGWSLGLLFLKLFVRCIMTGVFGEIELRNQLEVLMMRGLQHFDFNHFWQQIFLPIVTPLLDTICMPFFLSRLFGMLCLPTSYWLRSLLSRFCIHLYLGIVVVVHASWRLGQYLVQLHNEIRDERYLIARQLSNRLIGDVVGQN